MTEIEYDILESIDEGARTHRDIMAASGWSSGTIRCYVHRMRKAGLVEGTKVQHKRAQMRWAAIEDMRVTEAGKAAMAHALEDGIVPSQKNPKRTRAQIDKETIAFAIKVRDTPDGPEFRQSQLIAATNMNASTARAVLSRLKNVGLVDKTDSGSWYLAFSWRISA